jgi:hypothetical protein
MSTPSGEPRDQGTPRRLVTQQRLGDQLGVDDIGVVVDTSLELVHAHAPCFT